MHTWGKVMAKASGFLMQHDILVCKYIYVRMFVYIRTCVRTYVCTYTQVKLMAKSTVILSEHGTTSYSCLFARDGVVVIIIGHPPLKEGQVLLQVIYVPHVNR